MKKICRDVVTVVQVHVCVGICVVSWRHCLGGRIQIMFKLIFLEVQDVGFTVAGAKQC